MIFFFSPAIISGGTRMDEMDANGNMLVASYPDGPHRWIFKAKDHGHASHSAMTGFVIGKVTHPAFLSSATYRQPFACEVVHRSRWMPTKSRSTEVPRISIPSLNFLQLKVRAATTPRPEPLSITALSWLEAVSLATMGRLFLGVLNCTLIRSTR